MNQSNEKRSGKNIFFLVIIPIFLVILTITVGVLLYFSFYAPVLEQRIKYSIALALLSVAAPVGLFLLFIYGLNYARVLKILNGDYFVRWEYPKESGKGDVYFCDEGVYDTDKFYRPLDTFGSNFLGAEIPPDDPSVIRFTSLQYTGTRLAKSKRTEDVRIPPGKKEEAEKLVQRFQGYISRTSKHSKDQWRYVFPLLGVILTSAFLVFQFVTMPAGEEIKNEKKRQLEEWAQNRLKKRTEQITPFWNKIRQTLEPKFEKLKTLPDGRLTPTEAGFDEDSEVQTVLYGRCSPNNDFYVSVVLKKVAVDRDTTLFEGEIISGAFNYTTTKPIPLESYKKFCRPKFQEDFNSKIILTDGWVYGEINVRPLSATQSPAANSKTNK